MQCPFCKEEVQDGAIKCKHCQSMLNGTSNTNSLLSQLLPFRKWLLLGIFALSILAFFFTNVSITLPIIGNMNYSMYDTVKKIDLSKHQQSSILAETKEEKPNLTDIVKNIGKSENGGSKVPFLLLSFALLGLALHYLFTIIWGICTFVIHKTFRLFNIVWLALAAQFPILFSLGGKIIISDLKNEMTSKGGADNPFAQLGAAMMSSMSIDPGIVMWILMIVAIIGLAMQLMDKGKVGTSSVSSGNIETDELKQQNPIQTKKKWITIAIIAGSIILVVVILKFFGLIPGGDSGLDANRAKDKLVIGQQAPGGPTAPEPAPAPAPNSTTFSSDDLEYIKTHAGNITQEKSDQIIKGPLSSFAGSDYDLLMTNLTVGSDKLENDEYIMEGNAPHNGGSEEAILTINVSNGAMSYAILSNERVFIKASNGDVSNASQQVKNWYNKWSDNKVQ